MSKNSGGSLAFNGQDNSDKVTQRNLHRGNQTGLTAKANYGRGPTRGGDLSQPAGHGKPVTKDAYKTAPATASGTNQKRNPGGTCEVKCPTNPDRINVGN
jgi:hypothetical protein